MAASVPTAHLAPLPRLTLSPEGLKLVRKGKRKGLDLAWKDLVSGDAALAVALKASLKARRPLARGLSTSSIEG